MGPSVCGRLKVFMMEALNLTSVPCRGTGEIVLAKSQLEKPHDGGGSVPGDFS